MKKLFTSVLLLAFFSFTFAVDINLSNSMRLSENEWVVALPIVSVNFWLTQINSFDLVIDPSDYLIFHTPSNIQLNGNIINTSVSLDHKRLTFVWNFSWAINIDWIKIRSYDQKIYWAKLWLNYMWDSATDTYTTNIIQQDQDGRYTDNMPPLAISNLQYTLSWNNINLTRDYSPDLDLISTIVEIYKNNAYLRYYTIWAKDTTTTIKDLDITKDNFKIVVYSKDIYYMSDPTTVEIPKQTIVIDQSTWSHSTWITKYVPSINLTFFNNIITRLDNNISQYTDWADSIINKRNLFIQFLEDFMTKKIRSSQFAKQIKTHIEMILLYRK